MQVYYVSYGSNMNLERFLCYILGGRVEGLQKDEQGCHDKTLPKEVKPTIIPHELRFLKHAKKWENGGVGFISKDSKPNTETFAVQYLIDAHQFIDIVKQENAIDINQDIDLTVSDLKKNESKTVFKNSWYGELVYLGMDNDIPCYTFTCNESIFNEPSNIPSNAYLKTIINGYLKTGNDQNIDHVLDAFLKKDDIKNYNSRQNLKDLLRS